MRTTGGQPSTMYDCPGRAAAILSASDNQPRRSADAQVFCPNTDNETRCACGCFIALAVIRDRCASAPVRDGGHRQQLELGRLRRAPRRRPFQEGRRRLDAAARDCTAGQPRLLGDVGRARRLQRQLATRSSRSAPRSTAPAPAGRSSSVWYELVPAPSRPIHMSVHPGDSMFASVTVSVNGQRVVLSADQTRPPTLVQQDLPTPRRSTSPRPSGSSRRRRSASARTAVRRCRSRTSARDVRPRGGTDDERAFGSITDRPGTRRRSS